MGGPRAPPSSGQTGKAGRHEGPTEGLGWGRGAEDAGSQAAQDTPAETRDHEDDRVRPCPVGDAGSRATQDTLAETRDH